MISNREKADLVVFVGPSGCGKTTLIRRLRADYPDLFGFSISHTTRSPRDGEKDGADYYFITRKQFKTMVASGEMVEYSALHRGTLNAMERLEQGASSTAAAAAGDVLPLDGNKDIENGEGHFYGTSKHALGVALSQNRAVLMDTDALGAFSLRSYCRANSNTESVKDGSSSRSSSSSTRTSGGSVQSNNAALTESQRKDAGSKRPRFLRCEVILIVPPSIAKLEKRLRDRGSEDNASLAIRLDVSERLMKWAKKNKSFFDHIIVNDELDKCYEEVKRAVIGERRASPLLQSSL